MRATRRKPVQKIVVYEDGSQTRDISSHNHQ